MHAANSPGRAQRASLTGGLGPAVPRPADGGVRISAAGEAPEAARAEVALREHVRVAPKDFEARWRLAELLSATARPAEAARELEAAVRVAPGRLEQGRAWVRIGEERARLGLYDESLDAYERKLALGDADPFTLVRSAELLMALGRLTDARGRFVEAVALEQRLPEGRERIQAGARAYFGLALAEDRAGADAAAREAMGRALALDPGLTALERSGRADLGDTPIPPADALYCLGLVRESQARFEEAAAAFSDYLRVAGHGLFTRQAREHLAGLTARGRSEPLGPGTTATTSRWRVVHQATLYADGPLVAPLIDAAWRMEPRLLEACLSPAGSPAGDARADPRSSLAFADVQRSQISVDLRIEADGGVSAVSARSSDRLGQALGPCIERAVQAGFRVSRPSSRKATRARMELVLAPAPADGL